MINSEKIKIMLSHDDMARYDIQIYSLSNTENAIKETFREVLSEIREQTGFDTLSGRALMQVYPAKDGGCEIYITKFPGDVADLGGITSTENHLGRPKRRFKNVIFVFETLADTMDACKVINSNGYSRKSSLFRDVSGYYLIIENEIRPKNAPDELAKIYDYGKKVAGKVTEAYIREHMETVISQNAVDALSL